VCRPIDTPTHAGKHYFGTIIDDHSRHAAVYLLKNKSDMTDAIKHFLERHDRDHTCRRIRSDQGGEYSSRDLATFLERRGISHEMTPSHTPEYNGVAERFNRSILNIVRAFLKDADLSKSFWGEALSTATHIYN
jgi:transposase InsO family protein